MELTLESLGITQEQLQERVVASIADRIMSTVECATDEDGEPYENKVPSKIADQLKAVVKSRTDAAIQEIADKYILPNAAQYIENVRFQMTNQYGEPKREPETFREYLSRKAEYYLTDKVNSEGKSKDENTGYSWSPTQTRIAHMIHQHLHYQIETVMKQAVGNANVSIANGIQEAVKLKLAEIANALKVSVTTK